MTPMEEPGRAFLGVRVKGPWVPDAAWFPPAATGVEAVCSVSDCLSEPPPGWIDRWDFNRARCDDSEAVALATLRPGEETRYACFASHLVAVALDSEGRRAPVDPDALFDERLPPLPAGVEAPAGYVRLGYDAVSVGSTRGVECSPLSCNGMAKEIPVNRSCLVDDLKRALEVARRFGAEQPEPGDYVVVEVSARATDMARLSPCLSPALPDPEEDAGAVRRTRALRSAGDDQGVEFHRGARRHAATSPSQDPAAAPRA